MDHGPPRAQGARATFKKRLVVANMLDHRPRHDKIGGSVAHRKPVRRGVAKDPAFEVVVASQLLLGAVERDDRMRARLADIPQKRAIFSAADVKRNLPRPAVEHFRHLEFVDRMEVTAEVFRQPSFERKAEPPVQGEKA